MNTHKTHYSIKAALYAVVYTIGRRGHGGCAGVAQSCQPYRSITRYISSNSSSLSADVYMQIRQRQLLLFNRVSLCCTFDQDPTINL